MAFGPQAFAGDQGRRSGQAYMHFFPHSAIAPCRERQSCGTHHVGALAARWWRHFHVYQRLFGINPISRWIMRRGYIDERRRVKKIAVCSCDF